MPISLTQLSFHYNPLPPFTPLPVPSPWGNLIFGTALGETIHGTSFNDTVWAGAGNDAVYGWAGNDLLRGDAGNDLLLGGRGADRLYGGVGDDDLRGGSENDRLYGDAGRDFLQGDSGDDILTGGADADTFRFAPEYDNGHDVITDFEDGIDTISFAAYEPPYTISMADLQHSEDASGVTITYGDTSVLVQGATWAEVQDDLVFA